MREVTKLLESHELEPNPVGLFDFLEAGIELREYVQNFSFTRNLSDILELIADFGEKHGIAREEMAYSGTNVFKELYISSSDPREALFASIRKGKERYQKTQSISLPPLIVCPEDAWSFRSPEVSPNFYYPKNYRSGNGRKKIEVLAGAVVCIPNADPGFGLAFFIPSQVL